MSVTVNKTRLPGSVIKTASGAVASISDARMRGAIGVEASFSPKQDLHGYSNPWPAGGGKNKFDIDKMVNTSEITVSNGVITVTENAKNSTKKLSELADLKVGESYTLTANTDGTEKIVYLYGTGANIIWTFGTSKTMTQDYLNALVFFYGGAGATSHITNFMIRPSSITDPTYAPYSNLCPISGITEASAWADPQYAGLVDWNQLADVFATTGKPRSEVWASTIAVNGNEVTITTTRDFTQMGYNIVLDTMIQGGHVYLETTSFKSASFAPTTVSMRLSDNWSAVSTLVKTRAWNGGGEYSLIEKTTSAGTEGNAQRLLVRLNGNTITGDSCVVTGTELYDLTQMFGETKADEIYALEVATPGAGVAYFKSLFPKTYYDYDLGGTLKTVSAVNGDPHNLTVQLGEERYGGSYDFVRGKLTLTKKYAVLNDASLWRSRTGTVDFEYNYEYKDRKLYSDSFTGVICSFAPVVYGSGTYARWIGASQYYFGIKSTDITIAQIQNYAENGDLTICYELATPIVIDMTPAEFELFHRNNFVWSDVGDTALTYAAIHEHGG